MWQMSKLHLMDGIRPLTDGETERGAMGLHSRLVQRLSALSQSARMQMLRLLATRQQSLSAQYLYPLMRMSLLLVILLLGALVRLVSRVRQMYHQAEARLQYPLDRFRYRLMQMYRQVVMRVQLGWDRLQLQGQRQYPLQEVLQRFRLAVLRLLQAIRFLSPAQSLSRLQQALVSTVTRLLGSQEIRSRFQQQLPLSGAWLTTVKQQAGQGLAQVKHQTGRLLTTVKRLIGKR